MKAKIDFGAEVDFLTKGELDQSLQPVIAKLAAYAEGLKWMRPSGLLAAASGVIGGPKQGYAWMVTLVTASASAAGTVTVALGETGTFVVAEPQVLAGAGPAVFTFSSRQLLVLSDEKLWIGTTAGTITRFRIHAVEAPAEELFKLVGG